MLSQERYSTTRAQSIEQRCSVPHLTPRQCDPVISENSTQAGQSNDFLNVSRIHDTFIFIDEQTWQTLDEATGMCRKARNISRRNVWRMRLITTGTGIARDARSMQNATMGWFIALSSARCFLSECRPGWI